jgi:hypothetical protein
MLPRAGWVKGAKHWRSQLALDASEHGGMLICGGVNGNHRNPFEI